MKTITQNYRFLLILFFAISTFTAAAQNPCDQCTDPWGPAQYMTLTGQSVNGKPPGCTYTFVYEYRERICNGQVEIDIISIRATHETNGTFCPLDNFSDCYNTRRSAIRSLVHHLGIPVTLSQEKSCYAMFTVDPPQAYKDCFLSPGETQDVWSAFIECDGSSCCSVTYTPNGDGTVSYTPNSALPCTPGSTPMLPPYLIWECNGQNYIIPVDQGQAIQCDDTCPTFGGIIHKNASVETVLPAENQFTLFPNPTNGSITLSYEVLQMDQLDLTVYNTLGQEVYSKQVQISNASSSITLDTDEWGAGIYTMRIQGNGELIESKRIQVID